MELRHLRYFRAVAEELHFGRAAARLHMEPQPLNFQIKQLERELGFALFSHRENRTHLTRAGSAFLAEAEDILTAAERAVEHGALVARGESGLMRVGYGSPLFLEFLAPAIKQFRTALPQVSFDLQLLRRSELERALIRQELDLGFALLPVSDDTFDALPIARVRPIVAVPAGDPLAVRDYVDWHELDGRDAISLEHRAPEYQRRLDAMLAEHGVKVAITQHADEVEAAMTFVEIGLGILILHLYGTLARRQNIVFLKLPADADDADYAAIWRRDNGSPLRARFVEIVAATGSIQNVPFGVAPEK